MRDEHPLPRMLTLARKIRFRVALGDAVLRPALRDQERALRVLVAQLDPDLVHRRFHVAIGDRALLGDDRDRLELGQERMCELVDLRLRRLAAGEHAEVDPDVSGFVEEGDLGEFLHCNR